MKCYVLSFKNYTQATIQTLHEYGLNLYISRWTGRLCATVRAEEKDREQLTRELTLKGYSPEWSEVFENQPA